MSVLGIVGVFRLCTVAEIVLCNKICATDIAVSFIELVVNNICNNLLASVPDMVNCLTVNSLFIAQTACIVLVACSVFTIGKADKLIQTIVSVSFSLTFGCLFYLIAVSVIGIDCLLNIAVEVKRIFLALNCLYFLLQKCSIIALSIIVAILSYIILRTGSRHSGTVAVIVILVWISIGSFVTNLDWFFSQSFQTIILIWCCFHYTIFIAHFASVRTIKIIWIFVDRYVTIALFVFNLCNSVRLVVGICWNYAVCKGFRLLVSVCIISIWNSFFAWFLNLYNTHFAVIFIACIWIHQEIANTHNLLINVLWNTHIEKSLKGWITIFVFTFFGLSAKRVISIACGQSVAYSLSNSSHIVISIWLADIFWRIIWVDCICSKYTVQCIISICCNIAVSVGWSKNISIKIICDRAGIVARTVDCSDRSEPTVILIICSQIWSIAFRWHTCVHFCLNTGIVVKVLCDILSAV